MRVTEGHALREPGAHTEALLREVGYSAEEIASLRRTGVAQ